MPLSNREEDFNALIQEGLRIVSEAQKEGILLRILGGCGLYIRMLNHRIKHDSLFRSMKRVPKDIDFVTYSKYRPKIEDFMMKMGYYADKNVMVLTRSTRHIYHSKEHRWHVDVIFDKAEFCHTINYKGLLEIDSPTVPLAELLLQKMQIVEINEKDLKDIILLLAEYDFGESDDDETINTRRIAKTLAKDWGFYYTFTLNAIKVKKYIEDSKEILLEDKNYLSQKIDTLVKIIENEPKTMKWKMRSIIGAKKKWYKTVEEVFR